MLHISKGDSKGDSELYIELRTKRRRTPARLLTTGAAYAASGAWRA